MKITLTKEDLVQLSTNTIKEIFGLIGESEEQTSKGAISQTAEAPYDMTTNMVKQFMRSVSDTTKNFLRVFAENNGDGKIENLLEVTGGDTYTALNGVRAGISRRLRNLYADYGEESYLLEWVEDDSKYEGYLYISIPTLKSLKEYFGIG